MLKFQSSVMVLKKLKRRILSSLAGARHLAFVLIFPQVEERVSLLERRFREREETEQRFRDNMERLLLDQFRDKSK